MTKDKIMERKPTIKEQGAKFWDKNPCGGKWNSYAEYMTWIRNTEPYFFEILDQYDWNDLFVADIGCGQGTTLNYLPSLGAHMIGLDMSLRSLQTSLLGAETLNLVSQVDLVQADAEFIPLASERFDSVISCGVLHHTPNTADAIKKIHRLLKPNGFVIIMLYHSMNPKWWATKVIRWISKFVDFVNRKQGTLIEKVR